jgi:DNA (cytosine-5)-methyltransferase 1
MAFEQEGFCIVRGPDILLGGDIRKWSCEPNKFDGVIGGPPCKIFSNALQGQISTTDDMTPDFVRIVKEANPFWWVMENVTAALDPKLPDCKKVTFDSHMVGAKQYRVRSFWSNLKLEIEFPPKETRDKDPWPTVTATEWKYHGGKVDRRRAGRKVGRKMTLEEVNVAMGLPIDFSTPALTSAMQYEVRGNGVPLQMGRTVARAVRKALNG